MPLRAPLLLAAVLVVAMPDRSHAQLWSPSTGVSVCGPDCVGYEAHVASDGEGGVYIAWTESRNYATTRDDAYLQRITASGQVAPGWPAGGLALCALPRTQHPTAIAPDGEGGVFVTWYDDRSTGATFGTSFDVYVQRVRGDGSLAPGWPVDGAPATRALYSQYPEALVADGAGGVYVVWLDYRDYPANREDLYAQHLTATGTVAPGWPADGLPVSTALDIQFNSKALADGSGGIVIAWESCRDCSASPPGVDTYSLRLLPDGSIAAGWATNGSLLATDRASPQIAPDEAGGFYLASSRPGGFYFSEHWVHRFTSDGGVAPGWPAGGIPVCRAQGERVPVSAVADGFGGVLFTWIDYGRIGPAVIFATRVLPEGAIAPGWAADGVPVSQPLGGQSGRGDLAADGAGGAYLCWEWTDYQTFNHYAVVQHLTGQGAVFPGWPASGVLASTSFSQSDPRVVSDGAGGVIVVWDEVQGRPRSGLFTQRFAGPGVTATVLALARMEVTSEQVRLAWEGPGAGALAARVERRTTRGDREPLGAAVREGPDRLSFEDRSIVPGERYAYRLRYLEDGSERFTSETWVDVPERARFALQGLTPNPSLGVSIVRFSLGSAEPATLEVFDLRGRRMYGREVGGLGPGTHSVRLDEGAALPAGIYSIRLRQGDSVAVKRAVVVR